MKPDEDLEGGIPQPTPWYRTQTGMTVLLLGLLGAGVGCWHAKDALHGLAADVVFVVGVASMIAAFIVSGVASTKGAGEVLGRE